MAVPAGPARVGVGAVGLALGLLLVALLSVGRPVAARAEPAPERLLYQPFSHDAAPGTVATVYQGSLWMIDAAGSNGVYREQNVSAHDGYLDFTLRDGHTGGYVAFGSKAGFPPGTRFRFSIKVTGSGEGWGMAHLLWPASEDWSEGELDFPEGQLSARMKLYHHTMHCRALDGYCGNEVVRRSKKYFDKGGWHQVDIRWTTTYVKYRLDGETIATVDTSVPTTPHRPVIQVGLAGDKHPHGRPTC